MSENNIKRINLRMGQGLHDWYLERAKALGVPTSSLMIMALNEYRKLEVSSESVSVFKELYDQEKEQIGNGA